MENIFLIKALFWTGLFIIFYTYAGYGLTLYLIVKAKRLVGRSGKTQAKKEFEPEVSFVVPCYNELECIEQKVENTLNLDYPKDKLKVIFITDGSTDGTPEKLREFAEKGVQVLHEDKRGGKSAAENRAMKYVKSPIVIFSDANTILASKAVREIVKHYADPQVGAVSGEKRILQNEKDTATAAGEGFYWKYESALKKLDSELQTIVGAAGELFSFRSELFTDLEEDTILDDFMLSMRIASRGYRVIYEPNAFAVETASATVSDELKRKIRICAGGWQSMRRLTPALNPFKDTTLAFQYIGHRVLRWSVTPFFLLMLIPLNLMLFTSGGLYQLIMYGQLAFYSLAFVGWFLENRQIRLKPLFVPYYFFIMNYAVFPGFLRYIRGRQAAAWERSRRAPSLAESGN